ncbi:hypothetical protein BD779DRAFT_797299 [Infundibulicybe gibba]|nr:hypothetical protein BD779DRAFT_797299 [Infundibulicybe gibba]
MNRLPRDIWHQISQYIPVDTLGGLYGVSRNLFDIAMKARYETVHFMDFSPRQKSMCRNLDDPSIGPLVRCVHITPWLVKPRERLCNTWTASLWNRLHRFIHPGDTTKYQEQRTKDKIQKDISGVAGVVHKLKNWINTVLTGMRIQIITRTLQGFLHPVMSQLNNQLIEVSLKLPPEILPFLHSISLPRLQKLELHLSTGRLSKRAIDEYLDPAVIFINNLFRTLQSFVITTTYTSESLDLSQFFNKLGHFPHLSTFDLLIPFDGTHLSKPSMLVKFLGMHYLTLTRLRLSTTRCVIQPINNDPEWVYALIGPEGPKFAKLECVEIPLRPLKSELKPIMAFLDIHSPPLMSVALTDRGLSYCELRELIGVLGGVSAQLRHLRVRLRQLDPEAITLIVTHLPQLQSLGLEFSEIASSCVEDREYGNRVDELSGFLTEMKHIRYNSSGLLRINIPPEGRWSHKLELAFMESFPSLEGVSELVPSSSA